MKPYRILVVEDHADIRSLVRMTLEFEYQDIHDVSSAEEALEKLPELMPDLVVLDVMMSGLVDGYQLCRHIKSNPALAHIAVLLLTSRGQARDIAEGRQAGADAYIVKPFSPLELIKRVGLSLQNAAGKRPDQAS